ncbi:MAG: nucleotidyltransferase family protein [Ruminococcaceae bacterium]|nr:nucleotidyltransferase family protein [Oscillospiraceae bacterium]
MKIAAVIAEYNPFHNGHNYHIQKTREKGCSHVIAVMSGNFVQRGTPAVLDRFVRAQAAVQCGVDLVIELPLPWSASAAQDFADGAVQLIKATGIVDILSFGCESTDLQLLQNAINKLQADTTQIKIRQLLEKGLSYPAAVSSALVKAGETQVCAFLSKPNNMLAMEYCKCIADSNVMPLPILRIGCEHDAEMSTDSFASASFLRNEIYRMYNSDFEIYNLYNAMPIHSLQLLNTEINNKSAPVDLNKFNLAAIARLQMLSPDNLTALPYVGNGIQHRLYDAVQHAVTFEQACDIAKNKQITHARIRRTLLQATLGMYKLQPMKKVPYLRVLAMNQAGRSMLKKMQTEATLPIIMRHADAAKLDDYALQVYNFNQSANDFYNLCLPNPLPGGVDKTKNIFIEI